MGVCLLSGRRWSPVAGNMLLRKWESVLCRARSDRACVAEADIARVNFAAASSGSSLNWCTRSLARTVGESTKSKRDVCGCRDVDERQSAKGVLDQWEPRGS